MSPDRLPTPLDMPDPRPVPSIAEIRHADRVLALALEQAVSRLLLQGATWTELGKALGVSRQAATKRWGYLEVRGVAVVKGRDGAHFRLLSTGVEAVAADCTPAALAAGLRVLEGTVVVPS